MNLLKLRSLGFVANVVAVMGAAALIWLPEISAYWVWPPAVSDAAVAASRSEPKDELLVELSRQRLGMGVIPRSNPTQEKADAVKAADMLLQGQAQFKWQPLLPLKVPFERSNLVVGPPTFSLFAGGMGTVDIFLRAYRVTAEDKYLAAARAEVASIAEVDRWSVVPKGLFWNDHALAYRMAILIEYWQVVRQRPDFDEAHLREVLKLASRTATRLAKPELFTYRTNHGVMQNVALLQYVTAFPMVHTDASRLRELACSRLRDQMRFYIAPEGPVLEHSAGYHELGDYILGTSIKLFEANRCEVPGDWGAKLVAARGFSSMLNRPDGSLPSLGNTDYAEVASAYDEWDHERPRQVFGIYPVSGFAVWWSGLQSWPQGEGLSQTVVTWSKFPSRAHKRADDMSVILWADGQSITGNSGYWPYGIRGFESAQGWRGSNAPHFVQEAGALDDTVVLRGSAATDRVRVIELERKASGDAGLLRRQIVEVDGSTWLIADSFTSPQPQQLERIWTFMPDSSASSIAPGAVLITPAAASQGVRLSVVGDTSRQPAVMRGEYEPFGGWTVSAGVPLPAAALEVRQDRAGVPVLSVFERGPTAKLGAATLPQLAPGASTDQWQVDLKTERGLAKVSWNSGQIEVSFSDGSKNALALTAPPDPLPARSAIVSAYHEVAAKYDVHRPITYYRFKITYLALGLLLLQEVVLLVARRRFTRAVPALRWLSASCWCAFGVFAAYWYLV